MDLDHGTFPFVTSSNSTAGGACTGTGVPPTAIGGAIGVVKAYSTRVGGGPFPSEISGEAADFLRQRGNEYGTTTGRPRRCGWFDTVVARYARRINGIGVVAVTKLDVLDHLAEIPVCVGYRFHGELLREFPFSLRVLEEAQPLYRVFKGWQEETAGILELERLPAAARDYLDFLEQEMEAPVGIVSTGPRREETILRHDLAPLAQLTSGRFADVVAQREPG